MSLAETLLFAAPSVDDGWIAGFTEPWARSETWLDECRITVERTYARDPAARDGFSRVAFALLRKDRLADAVEWFERDWAHDRMRRWQFLRYLEALLALGRSGDAETRVAEYYARHPEAVDGWATIAWTLEAAGDIARACELAHRDRALSRLSVPATMRLSTLEARAGDWPGATQLVQGAYDRDRNLRDGFARVAQVALNAQDWRRARELLETDHTGRGLSAPWVLRLAEAEAGCGHWERAEMLVAEAYARDATLHSGYARLARFRLEANEWESARVLLQRDQTARGLAPWWTLRWAEAEAGCGRWTQAEALVADAYSQDGSLQHGYARIARFRLDAGEWAEARDLLEKDQRARGVAAAWVLRWAEAEAGCGHWAQAEALVADAYARDESLRNGYARLARFRLEAREWDRACILLEGDERGRGLAPYWKLELAALRIRQGDLPAAIALVEQAYAQDDTLRDRFGKLALLLAEFDRRADVLDFLARDQQLGRQSPRGALRLAAAMVTGLAAPDLTAVTALVDEAYRKDPDLRDGYVAVARALELAGTNPEIHPVYERDLERGRMTSAGLGAYVQFLVRSENRERVAAQIATAYAAYPDLCGGYAVLARTIVETGDIEYALEFFARDEQAGRATDSGRLEHALALFAAGQRPEADAIVTRMSVAAVERVRYARETLQPQLAGSADDVLNRTDHFDETTAVWASLFGTLGREPDLHALLDRDTKLADGWSCAARAALANGDTDLARRCFQRDRERQQAHRDSLLQYAFTLADATARDAVLEEALPSGHFPRDAWLAERRHAFRGQTCFILGTGPSIRGLDPARLRGHTVFATNGSYLLPGLEFQFFVTVAESFWRQHQSAINALPCERMFLPHWLRGALSPSAPVTWMNAPLPRGRDAAGQTVASPLGFSRIPDRYVALGGTVIGVCLQLAHHLGFARAVLLGVDHNYGDHGIQARGFGGRPFSATDHAAIHFTDRYYRSGIFYCDLFAMERAYALGRDAFAADGRTVLNATPGTKLDVIPRADLADLFQV